MEYWKAKRKAARGCTGVHIVRATHNETESLIMTKLSKSIMEKVQSNPSSSSSLLMWVGNKEITRLAARDVDPARVDLHLIWTAAVGGTPSAVPTVTYGTYSSHDCLAPRSTVHSTPYTFAPPFLSSSRVSLEE